MLSWLFGGGGNQQPLVPPDEGGGLFGIFNGGLPLAFAQVYRVFPIAFFSKPDNTLQDFDSGGKSVFCFSLVETNHYLSYFASHSTRCSLCAQWKHYFLTY